MTRLPRSLPLALLLVALICLPLGAARSEAREGGTKMQLIQSWSVAPDGDSAYLSWRGDLWHSPLDGGPATRLTTHASNDRYPQISPDGKTLAFVSDRDGPDHVYVMPAAGGPATQVTVYTGGFVLYGWFPDGRSLLVRARKAHHWRRAERFFRRTLVSTDPLELLFDAYGGSPAISPDGQQIAFVREGRAWWRKRYHGPAAGQIWRYDLKAKAFTKLTQGEHGERWPQWSADGKHLYFCSQAKADSFNLWRMDPDGGARTRLTTYADDSVVAPRISADGKTIVFRRLFDLVKFKVGSKPGTPAPLDIHHTGPPTLQAIDRTTLNRATDVAFSVDAREIAFVAGGDIWVMDTELREPRRVTNTPAEEREPLFSADFETLTFVSDAAGQPDIFQARRTDTELWWWQNTEFKILRLTNDPASERALRPVPGGSRIAFLHGNGNLRTMAADGSDRKTLLEHWDGPDFHFSPDGKWLAWSRQDNDFNSDVWIQPVDGSKPAMNLSLHPDHDHEPRWSPDGKRLAWLGHRNDDETDIYYVWLAQADDEERGRDRTLEKALKKMKGRKVPPKPTPAQPKQDPAPEDPAATAKAAPPASDATGLTGQWRGRLSGPPPIPEAGYAFTLEITKTKAGWVADMSVPGQFEAEQVVLTLTEAGGEMAFEATTPLGPLSGSGKIEGETMSGRWSIEGVMQGTYELVRQKPVDPAAAAAGADTPATDKTTPRTKATAKPKPLPKVVIDFEGISDRIRRIRIRDADESGLLWSADGKKLSFRTSISGKRGRYTVTFPDSLTPKLLTTSSGSSAAWLKEGNQIAWLSGGTPATVSASGKTKSYAFRVRSETDLAARNGAAFQMAWRTMRDSFYDERLGKRDWNVVRTKYGPMAARCVTGAELELVVNLMLGELNGSHLGFRSMERTWRATGWQDVTGDLGCLFADDYEGAGLKVDRVVPGTPADEARTRIHPGEIIVSIDGRPVSAATNLDRILTGDPSREVAVAVRSGKGEERVLKMRLVSHAVVRARRYEMWQADTRAQVATLSDGRLGYLHIRGMNWSSFQKFEAELYKVGHGKDGLIIDVRENGGGFTTDHLLTCLTQPRHAITRPRGGGRGYPQGRMVYASWQKPIIVLCNQNSFSNAEIFAHAVKHLGRGQIVGVKTAGGVISAGGTTIMGIGTLRLPFRGWYVAATGADMELAGCVPHHTVWPKPGELPTGIDRQLDKAVSVLLEDVAKWKARPKPTLRKASER